MPAQEPAAPAEPAAPPAKASGEGGTCGGIAGLACAPGLYCSFPPEASCGAADRTGTCTAIPQFCTREFSPVCGCDDKTYSNACEAAAASVSILKKGACEGAK